MKDEQAADAVVEAVRADLKRRSDLGLVKYGVSLENSGLGLREFLQHAYEETLDNANYLMAAMMKLDGKLP